MSDDLIRRSDALAAMAPMLRNMLSRGDACDKINSLPSATPTVQDAAKVLLDALNTSDGFRAAANAAIPILRADIKETAWNTPGEVVLAISAAVRAIAGESK